MSWYDYFRSRPSVRDFGDNCFFPDSDQKRYWRAHFERSRDIFSYSNSLNLGYYNNSCHCSCFGGWQWNMGMNFGSCSGGWRAGLGMAVGYAFSNMFSNGFNDLACWLGDALGGNNWMSSNMLYQDLGLYDSPGDLEHVNPDEKAGTARRTRRAERKAKNDADQAALKALQDKIINLENPTEEELLAIQEELNAYKIKDKRYQKANESWLEGMKKSVERALVKLGLQDGQKTPEQIAAEQAAAEAERLAAEIAAQEAAEAAKKEAQALKAAEVVASQLVGARREDVRGQLSNPQSLNPLLSGLLSPEQKTALTNAGLSDSSIEILLNKGLTPDVILNIVNDFEVKEPNDILFISKYKVEIIKIEGKNGVQEAISLPSTVDKTTLNKLIEISETAGMPIACANNPSADEDKWIAGTIDKNSIKEENGKLSWSIDCSEVGKYGYSYSVTQGEGNKYTVTVTSNVGADNRKGTAREFELEDGLLRRDDKEETVQNN